MSALAALGSPVASAAMTATQLASEPESVRRGGRVAEQAYEEGLGFQSMLVSELAQQLTDTISGTGTDSDGLGGSDSSDSGSGGGSALGGYSSLLTSALSQGVDSGDQTGLAMQIARGIDPRLGPDVS